MRWKWELLANLARSSSVRRLLFIYIMQGFNFFALLVYVLLVYVDDIVLARNHFQAYADFKVYLNNCFRSKDLGPLKYFLIIEVACGPRGLFLY